MLYTRNAFHFRKFYKEEVARESGRIDLNFVGSLHPDKKRRETGFSKLIYGNREDLGKLLGTIALNVAADDQAIYELIQNADDCKSSFFSVSYNEDYLLCINNGNYFSDRDMSAIINVAGNYKDGEDIGTFGIGFKILHRLVGADDGREAIINDYAGPIIFSWNKFFQLNAFLNDDEVKVGFDVKKDNENPWLVKLLYTCFPSHLDEKLKLQNYDTEDVKFSKNELSEMRTFLKQSLQNVNLKETNNLKSGSIFFLKLGKGKSKFLDDGIDKIKSGLSYSFKFLNSLQKIYINGEEIKAQTVSDYSHSFPINSEEFKDINPKNKNRDIKFTFAFYRDYKKAANLQNELAPNLYTFFSMDEEKNGFSFLLHCNAFDMNNDRRKLQANSQINEKLLPIIAQNIIEYSNVQKGNNRNLFLSLYANFLLSKDPKNKPHIDNNFSKHIHQYIIETIPTKKGFSDNPQNVKINKLKQQLNLSDFGLNNIEWFEWDNEADNLLIDEAKNKLGIESWDIRDIVENSDLESINNWIANCDNETYGTFLKELEESALRIKTKERICQIKLFKFSKGKFYSINEVLKKDTYGKTIFSYTNCFFSNSKTKGIKNELVKLGLVVSDLLVEEYPNIFSSVILPDDKKHYDLIAKWCVENANKLTAEEKKNLFLNFINETTKFDNVAEGTLKDLCLFCDSNSEIKPLNKLIDFNLNTPHWLNVYKIKNDEFFTELKTYLVSEQEAIFEEIYLPQQGVILSELTEAKEIKSLIKLYQDNQKQFFKEFIIKKSENGFFIAKKTNNTYQVQSADQEARGFIDTNCSDKLFVMPYDFLEFKEEEGIIKNNDLYTNIIDCVEVDKLKEELITIISHHYVSYQAKLKFLNKLTELSFQTGIQYTNDNYEYKILDLACEVIREPQNFSELREKIIIKSNNTNYQLSEISLFADKIKISNKEFSLSKILPATHQNSNLVGDLISLFTKQGISNEKLNALFGVNEELDIEDVFEKYAEQTEVFENTEQFFFLISYNKHIEKVDLSKLGFDLNCAVFPSDFALENEKLPEYLQNWITKKEIDLLDLDEIGVFTENSTLVSLRKFFLSKTDFNVNTIAEKLSSNEIMLFNTFELLKEKGVKLSSDKEFSVFKEIVRVINSSRTKGQELIIQDEYNFGVLKEKSTEWKTINDFSIFLYRGALPKFVKLDEIQDYIFYQYNDTDFAVNGNSIFINECADSKKTLQKVASDDSNKFSFEELWSLFEDNKKDTQQEKQEDPNPNTSFLDDVNEFISELEGTEWNDFVPELKNILELSVSHPKEKQKLFNLIAKIKLAKELDIHFEVANKDYNNLENGNEKYFVHSARGAFAYIHPNEILKMKDEGYKMALDFSTKSRIKIYKTAEEILQLNTNHILAYQHEKTMDELFSFCQANSDANKHLLIIDKNNSGEKSRALLKLLNIEDDYQ